jgi:hypothetical protein
MSKDVEQLHRRLVQAEDHRELLNAKRELSNAIGRLPPKTSDDVRKRLIALLKTPQVAETASALEKERSTICSVLCSVLRGQMESKDYGTQEAVAMKGLQERVLLYLYEHLLSVKDNRDASDGVEVAAIAKEFGLSVDEVMAAIYPIFPNHELEGSNVLVDEKAEWVQMESDLLVLTGDGQIEAQSIYQSREGQRQETIGSF